MDVAFYWGGDRVNYDHLNAALEANGKLLEAENIIFSPNSSKLFRPIFAANKAIKSGTDIETVQKDLFERLSIDSKTKKLLLIDPKINGTPSRPFPKGISNRKIFNYFDTLKTLFTGHSFRLYIEIQNPVTLIPSAYSEGILNNIFESYEDYLAETNVNDFKWSSHIQRLQGGKNQIEASIWRHEDYPKIWRDVIGAFTGVANHQDLVSPGKYENNCLNFKAAQLLYKYTKEYPNLSDTEIEDVQATFLRHFPYNPDDTLSGHFTSEMAETLTHQYDDDWYYIERMDRTEILLPRKH